MALRRVRTHDCTRPCRVIFTLSQKPQVLPVSRPPQVVRGSEER